MRRPKHPLCADCGRTDHYWTDCPRRGRSPLPVHLPLVRCHGCVCCEALRREGGSAQTDTAHAGRLILRFGTDVATARAAIEGYDGTFFDRVREHLRVSCMSPHDACMAWEIDGPRK